MDTIILVVTMVGASLMMALLFASSVLSYKWWKLIVIYRHTKKRDNISRSQEQLDANRKTVSNPLTTINSGAKIKTKQKSQTLVQLKRISGLSELIDKKVKTCEMVGVGHIIDIDKQSMIVLHDTKQKYIIPTYFIRECNQEYVVIDISIRYLYHYKPEQELQSSQIQRESIQSKGRQQQRSQLELPTRAASNNSSITTSQHTPRTLSQTKQSSDILELINKRVVTSSKGDIGYVYMIDKEFITVLQGIKQQYVIPTHCIKEYDEENVFIEISAKSLNSCKVRAKL